MLEGLWSLKIQLIPVLIAVISIELPAIMRRFKKYYYVPIYFSIFPFRELNKDLSTYLAEDYMYDEGGRMDELQAEKLRRRIIFVSIISMAISALITPLVVGFLGSFYLTHEMLLQFIVILVSYKLILLIKSIWHFRLHSIGSKKNIALLSVVYFCYLGVITEMIKVSFTWASKYVKANDWIGLLSSLSDVIFGKVVAFGIILTLLLNAIFISRITDRDLRRRNLSDN